MTPSAVDALEAGLLALGYTVRGQREPTDRAAARKVLAVATTTDPTLADAWLARLYGGETALAVYEGLWRSRDRLGVGLARLGLLPADLGVRCDSGLLITYPLISPEAVTAAYVTALLDAGRYSDAVAAADDDVAAGRPMSTYATAAVYVRTQRWPQVIETVRPLRDLADPLFAAAARAITVQAMTNLGLHQAAVDLAAQPVAGKTITDHLPLATATVGYHVAMSQRALGNEAAAQEWLRTVLVADPDHGAAREMLARPDLGIQTIDASVIDSRTDPWDPATAVDPAVLERDRMAGRRAELLAEAQAEMDAQIGLVEVKRRVAKLKASVVVNQARVAEGLPATTRSNHLVFEGPPGTGKTTLARIVAKFYCGLGILPTDTIIEVKKPDLVGQHIGDTEAMTKAAVKAAEGGVLLIDEAPALATAGSANDFGLVALRTLVPFLEDARAHFVCIVAGYSDEMPLLFATDPGLRSRFGSTIVFPSYGPQDLLAIGDSILTQTLHHLDDDAAALLSRVCTALQTQTTAPPLQSWEHPPTIKTPRAALDVLGNGRFVRNVVEAAILEQQARLEPMIIAGQRVEHGRLMVDDIAGGLAEILPANLRAALSDHLR